VSETDPQNNYIKTNNCQKRDLNIKIWHFEILIISHIK
jgi:hypothetical protein